MPSVPFTADPNVDRLFAMVFALSAELTAVSEQLDTLRRVMQDQGLLQESLLASYRPSPEVLAERERTRRAFIEALMASFEQDIEPV
jgi:hypothetical protein